MAETYTDAKGNVFPVDAYGRPQGYWQSNQFIYPQFGKNFAEGSSISEIEENFS